MAPPSLNWSSTTKPPKASQLQLTTGVSALGVDGLLKLEKELQGNYSLYWQPNVTDVWHVFSQMLWKSWTYLVSDKVQTETGPFVTPLSL